MESNPMARKPVNYKGYLVEYSGTFNPDNPIEVYFDKRHEMWHVVIHNPISQFLTDMVTEKVKELIEMFNESKITLDEIRTEFGLFKEKLLSGKGNDSSQEKPEARWSKKLQSELLEILERKIPDQGGK